MSPEEKKQKYIELKLSGAIDNKKELKKQYNINKDIKNIGLYVMKELKMSVEDYNELSNTKGKEIQQIKKYYSNIKQKNNKFNGLEKFYEWYKNEPKECCYCGVKEEYLKKYFNEDNIQYKGARQRGKILEIERVVTSPKKENVYSKDNCKLACYICNNAKSDFISPQGFKHIAKGISEFWNKKDAKAIFDENSDIWSKG